MLFRVIVSPRVIVAKMLSHIPLLSDSIFKQYPLVMRSRDSSASIVSLYRLDVRVIEVRSPAEEREFSSSLCVQTGSGAHPASCTMGTGGPFHGVKRGRGVTLTSHPHLVPRSWVSRSYTSSLPCASIACVVGQLYLVEYSYLCDSFIPCLMINDYVLYHPCILHVFWDDCRTIKRNKTPLTEQ
jgi:hypothetical protein